uniref:Uncharacterized protein n=1 Tax=Strigamia maritima TaxID=126957 RepID=T1IMZ6_STRMM
MQIKHFFVIANKFGKVYAFQLWTMRQFVRFYQVVVWTSSFQSILDSQLLTIVFVLTSQWWPGHLDTRMSRNHSGSDFSMFSAKLNFDGKCEIARRDPVARLRPKVAAISVLRKVGPSSQRSGNRLVGFLVPFSVFTLICVFKAQLVCSGHTENHIRYKHETND